MKHFLIFAGTIEGRELVEYYLNKGYRLTVCTATEYGKLLLPVHPLLTVISKRLEQNAMYELMLDGEFDCVFDCTHPYAVIVTENIKAAAKKALLPYHRIIRPKEDIIESEKIIYVDSMEDAVSYLAGTKGNILVTTGSKELKKLLVLPDYKERIYARIISNPEMVRESFELGFQGKHLICMQGPFSEELNTAMIHQYDIAYLLTKHSGKAGGFLEKANSARNTRTILVVIGRPIDETDGYLLKDILDEKVVF